ncbi:MAG: sigma-70 family RNA polymerase sigma factor [Pirellulaceae bacterium]
MTDEISVLLDQISAGDPAASERLLTVLYQELKQIATGHMRRERADHTLQPTALVHEAFLKLVDQRRVQWQGKSHFCAVASQVMRRILVDHARHRNAAKRGQGAQRLAIDEHLAMTPRQSEVDLVALDECLNQLAELNPRQARIVEMRYFAGMTIEETAAALDVSVSTVKGDWRLAKAFLVSRLAEEGEG